MVRGVRPAHLVEHQVPTATSPVVGSCLKRRKRPVAEPSGVTRLPSCGTNGTSRAAWRQPEIPRGGGLGFLNREYRRRRIESQENGQGSLRRGTITLRQAIATKLTGDVRSLVSQVFGSR